LRAKTTLTLPVGTTQSEVDSRLKRLARTADGRFGQSADDKQRWLLVHYEVMNDNGEVFLSAAAATKPSCVWLASRESGQHMRA
jgi:trigger factor